MSVSTEANLPPLDTKANETMTTTMTQSPTPASAPDPSPSGGTASPTFTSSAVADSGTGVTFRRLLSAEWLKFRSVRSNVIALAGAAVAAVGFGTLFSWLAESEDGPGSDRFGGDGLSLSLGGFDLAVIIIAILGIALVAGEYQSGLIRTWLAAAPSRLQTLGAKVTVYSSAVFVVSGIAATTAFLAGQAVLPDSMTTMALTDDGVMQALAGTALYASAIAAIGVGLGFLLRSTAAGASVVVILLMIAPGMIGLLPSSFSDPVAKILPSNAADAVTGMATGTEVLSTGWGVATLAAWVIGTVGAAALILGRRDA